MKEDHTLATELTQTSLLLTGLAAHAEVLSKRGLDSAFITQFNAKYDELIETYAAQQAFKARMMEKTDERDTKRSEVRHLYRLSRKLVKLELPPETWREFGITDQR